MSTNYVTRVRAYVLDDNNKDEEKTIWECEGSISCPMSKYLTPQEKQDGLPLLDLNDLGTMIAEVELKNGIKGYGITTCGELGCFIIEKHLSKLFELKNAKCFIESVKDIRIMYDKMKQSVVGIEHYGGIFLKSISAIDIALYDVLGKVLNLPVFKLLSMQRLSHSNPYGSKLPKYNINNKLTSTNQHNQDENVKIPVYCTTTKSQLNWLVNEAKYKFQGYKVCLPYNVHDKHNSGNNDIDNDNDDINDENFKRIEKTVKKNMIYLSSCREIIGNDIPLFVDAYMSFDSIEYSQMFIKHCLNDWTCNIQWIEEILLPNEYIEMRKLRKFCMNNANILIEQLNESSETPKRSIDKIRSFSSNDLAKLSINDNNNKSNNNENTFDSSKIGNDVKFDRTEILLTGGEHTYTIRENEIVLGMKSIDYNNPSESDKSKSKLSVYDILQPDIRWCGGVTGIMDIISMVKYHNRLISREFIRLIPHIGGMYSYHVIGAMKRVYQGCQAECVSDEMSEWTQDDVLEVCPMVEYCMVYDRKISAIYGNIFVDEPLPNKDGFIELDKNKYGFGVKINEDIKKTWIRPYKRPE